MKCFDGGICGQGGYCKECPMIKSDDRIDEIKARADKRRGMTNSELLANAWPAHHYVSDVDYLLQQLAEAVRRKPARLTDLLAKRKGET